MRRAAMAGGALAKALGEFRRGKRQNEAMSIVAMSLSDAKAP